MVIMVAITVMLPTVSGLVTYKKNPGYAAKKQEKKNKRNTNDNVTTNSNGFTYEAPDADIDADDFVSSKSSAFSGVRSKLSKLHAPKITENDIPIKLELVGESELKRRARGVNKRGKVDLNINPAAYDYDIDELIEEEMEKDEIEKRQMYGSNDV